MTSLGKGCRAQSQASWVYRVIVERGKSISDQRNRLCKKAPWDERDQARSEKGEGDQYV